VDNLVEAHRTDRSIALRCSTICRSQAPRVLGRSSGPAGPRSHCAVARPRRHPWPDSSKANAIIPHASS